MPRSGQTFEVYLEVGKKKTFAGALAWPGWCRSGPDEAAALAALLAAGPRYAQVLRGARLGFRAPASASALVVVERLAGNMTTDFGAPGMVPLSDARAVEATELRRLQAVLKASWGALAAAAESAAGQSLRVGPRGGGRTLEKIVRHVVEAEASYLSKLGGSPVATGPMAARQALTPTRLVILETLAASVRGEVAAAGPRGSLRWPPRYFVRRAAWHVLDHVWEIEDRLA